jgi:hypothetical protein
MLSNADKHACRVYVCPVKEFILSTLVALIHLTVLHMSILLFLLLYKYENVEN